MTAKVANSFINEEELPQQSDLENNWNQPATIEDVENIQAQIDEVLNTVKHLSTQFGAFLNLSRTNSVLSSTSEEDVEDMGTILVMQRKIIQTILTSESLSADVRQDIGNTLMQMPEWAEMDRARNSLQQRQKQRQLITSNEINQPSPVAEHPRATQTVQQQPAQPKRTGALPRRKAVQQDVQYEEPRRPAPARIPNQPMRRDDY